MIRRAAAAVALAAITGSAAVWAGAPIGGGGSGRVPPGHAVHERDGVRLDVPPGWRELPHLAEAAARPAADDRPAVSARAWGDPARGCYVVALSTAAGRAPAAAVGAWLRTGLERAGASLDDPSAGAAGERFDLERERLRGSVRLAVPNAGSESGRATAAACVYGDRDPDACRRACEGVLGRLEVIR